MATEMPDDLDLVAFRYVAGEMAADEASAFEARLADDQPAREAVSRAVALAERLAEAAPAIAPADAAPVETRRAGYGWVIAPLGWMAAGAAVALLAVSLLGRTGEGAAGSPPGAGGAVGPGEPRAHPDVDALVWARLQAGPQWAAADLERLMEEPGALSGDLSGEDNSSGEDDADWSNPQVPAWVSTTKANQNSKRGDP